MTSPAGTPKPGVDKGDFSEYLERVRLLGRAYPDLRGFHRKIEAWNGFEGDLVSTFLG